MITVLVASTADAPVTPAQLLRPSFFGHCAENAPLHTFTIMADHNAWKRRRLETFVKELSFHFLGDGRSLGVPAPLICKIPTHAFSSLTYRFTTDAFLVTYRAQSHAHPPCEVTLRTALTQARWDGTISMPHARVIGSNYFS